VLDEPNSSLDEAGERDLLKVLAMLKSHGSTVIAVTHRTNLLAVTNRILVLAEGQVRLFGPRDEVMARLRGVPAEPSPVVGQAIAAT